MGQIPQWCCQRWVCSNQSLQPMGRSSQHCLLLAERKGTVQRAHFVHDVSASPRPRCVGQPHETTEHPVHAFSMAASGLTKMCTLCQAPCTHRQVQVQRETLRELIRCLNRQVQMRYPWLAPRHEHQQLAQMLRTTLAPAPGIIRCMLTTDVVAAYPTSANDM